MATPLSAVSSEAGAIRELYWSAEGFPLAPQTALQADVRSYARTVVDHDWPQMVHGTLDDRSEQQLITMNNLVLRLDPQDAAASNAQLTATTQLATLFSTHDQRGTDAAARLPQGLIAGVIATSLVVGAFPFACGISATKRSVVLAAVQAALVGVGIVVVFQLNHVYSGPLAVSPAPIQAVLQQITIR